MKTAGLLLTILLPAAQDGAGDGLTVERSVKVTTLDWLGRRREIHRKETVFLQGGNLAVVDRTFGGRLVVRPDLKLLWKADPLAGEYSELAFDEIAAVRKKAFDEVRAARARVPGTPEERELEALLEGFDQFAAEPRVELKAEGARREVLVNGDRVRISAEVDPARKGGVWEALVPAGAFHPAVAAKLKDLGGLPVKGTLRYVLFLERVIEEFEVTASKPGPPAATEFELPKGLKKVPLAGFGPPSERAFTKPKQFQKGFREDDLDRSKEPPPEKKP